LADVDVIAVAHRPGLIGSLLVGVTAAKALAWALGKPLIGVDHVHAHLYSVMLEKEEGDERRTSNIERPTSNSGPAATQPVTDAPAEAVRAQDSGLSTQHSPTFPAVGLVCSGGHTALYELRDWLDVRLIGSTIDDAVGEAYDKVAALLGLGYPGGPILDKLAARGDPSAVDFPRSLLGRDSLDFSFSGLKTAVLYRVYGVPGKGARPSTAAGPPPISDQALADVAASFQAACIDVITRKLKRAAKRVGARSVIIGGGVSANRGLRAAMTRFGLPVHVPALEYCTDNAAMSGGLAAVYAQRGLVSPLDLDAIPYSQFVAG
jgi:N6-L-threonylcarbamoyladenine synthase